MPDAATIREASSARDYRAIKDLIREYADWCRELYRDEKWIMDGVFAKQSLAGEIGNLHSIYGPPNGRAFLAIENGEALGCGAWRRTSATVCEMKRLYVPRRNRGKGLGRALCAALVASARGDGCISICLDTMDRMTEAIAMYEAMGFKPCPPYNRYPKELLAHTIFLALPLGDQ